MELPSAAPRDLHFGLLALQIGLIDQDQLVAAFNDWMRESGKTLAEILVERGSIDAESRTLLAAMAEKQLKLHGGDAEKSLAAIAAGASTRDKLRSLGDPDLTASVALVGSLTPPDDATATMSFGTATSDGQRFRVLRPHAQGGLGAVFVALDRELNREVALKQILDHHADDIPSRARFLIEAEITGGLEHPGIVPVYGLGHYGDGRPFYAMRFIRGDSLKEAIAAFHADGSLEPDAGQRSLALRKLLRRFVDVCNAIDYAHGRGVLHRDLKPGNVIVGKHGETLVVDWGLAKSIGRAETGSTSDEHILAPSFSSVGAETLPGSAIGTPAYMSPEQAAGDLERLGPRSDVYSLGATLYCLLTGRPPFQSKDLRAVLGDVQKGAFPQPRQGDPSIDRALEAVCLKAMALNPEDRHTSARALADDVELWTADEPVSAWREPALIRVRRWMRRNRTIVSAASAAVLAALVGLAGVLAVQSQSNAKLREANQRVQARFDLAREAISSFEEGVTEDDMLKGKELEGLRNKLLRSAAGFYEKLETLLQGQSDHASRAILAQSYTDLGRLTEKIGIQAEALAVHRKALALRRELAGSTDSDVGTKLDLARSLNAIGLLSMSTGDNAGALSAYEEARAMVGPLAVGPGTTKAAQDVLGAIDHRIGGLLFRTGKSTEAMASMREGLAIQSELAGKNPGVLQYSFNLADSHYNIGLLLSQTGHAAEAMRSHKEALAIRRKLAEGNASVNDFRSSLADSHSSIGDLQAVTGHGNEALESFREALAIQRKLSEDNPAVTAFRSRLADFHNSIGTVYADAGHANEAQAAIREALGIQRKLAEDNPVVSDFQSKLALSHYNLGVAQFDAGQMADSLRSYRESLRIRRKLAKENPSVTVFHSNLMITCANIGDIHSQSGQPVEALESYREALAIGRKLAEDNPEITLFRNDLANSLSSIGNVQSKTGQPALALESYREAFAIRRKLAEDNPSFRDYQRNLAQGYYKIGQTRDLIGDSAGAVAEYRHAVGILEKIPLAIPSLYDLACYRSLLAGAAVRPRSGVTSDEAETMAQAAVSSLKRATDAGYRFLDHMRIDTDLDPLRARSDFQLLMFDLAFPDDPFVG